MLNKNPTTRLAAAVNGGKRYLGGEDGGSFLINEFGQILVPSQDGGIDVALVGECVGDIGFHNSLTGSGQFSFPGANALTHGDYWNCPYVGIPYHLSKWDEIYFWNEGRFGSRKSLPPIQDYSLVEAIRKIRPGRIAVRFIVTYGGIILTKTPPQWEPRYIGQIDKRDWYRKES